MLQVSLLVCRNLGADGSGSTSFGASCVRWCRAEGAHIMSSSWGGSAYSQALYDEIRVGAHRAWLLLFMAQLG